ncbi:hypothetical protein [Paenibacillus sp. P32E]|uniref:hypothetical protein n=1 Tax=Paenibacillus sp. P32E TaxID=1349434 RepID=UPI00095FFB2B|nr:hypothetical protein [Paenibacillus sp. P32E]OKP83720.1 hypothetical protein A3848_25925 [Paenibacillus sp. P32E]
MNYSKKKKTSLLISSFAVFPVSAFAEESFPESNVKLTEINVVHQETQKVTDNQLGAVLQIAKNAVEEERGNKVGFAKSADHKRLMIMLRSMNNILIFMKSQQVLTLNY